jgi:hypothetical protein
MPTLAFARAHLFFRDILILGNLRNHKKRFLKLENDSPCPSLACRAI